MKTQYTIAAYVLAGGKSSRMGCDKGLMSYRGKSMVQHTLECLVEANLHAIIVANSSYYHSFGHIVVGDIVQQKGPIGGLLTALTHTSTEYVLLLSCDTPHVTAKLVNFVASQIDGNDAVVPVYNGVSYPMCAAYSTNLKSVVQERVASNKLRMRDLVADVSSKFVDVTGIVPADVNAFANFNSMSDFELINQWNQ